MELVEISTDIKIDPGAPEPYVIASEAELKISFYSLDERDFTKDISAIQEKITLQFKPCLNFRMGTPGSETIYGHPYYESGITTGGFYELKDSDWINQLMKIDQVHPYFNLSKWKKYKHYILVFHDSLFECIASDFEIM
jgi:hypothetical protein